MIRLSIAATIIPLVANFQVCGSEDAPPPVTPPAVTASANITAPVVQVPTAKHGGTVVVVGNTSLEFVMKADGVIQAFPSEATAVAAAATPGAVATVNVIPPTATVTVNVPTVEGRPTPVELAWTPGPTPSFEGRVVGTVVRPGPVSVSVANVGPAPLTASIEASPVVVVPSRGGTLVDVGDAKLEFVLAANGTVQAYPIFPTVASLEVIPPAATITVDVPVAEGPAKPTTLTWAGPIASFEGRVDDGIEIVPGPLAFHVVHGERRVEARAPTFTVSPPSAIVVTGPQFGGTVVDIEGGQKLELVVAEDGRVDAYPYFGYVGAPMIAPNTEVTVEVPVASGPPRPVSLVWNAEGRFGGNVEGAVVRPGPVGVVVMHGGVRHRGNAPTFVMVRPAPRVRVVGPPPRAGGKTG